MLDERLTRVELLLAFSAFLDLSAFWTEEIIDSILLASAAGFNEIDSF